MDFSMHNGDPYESIMLPEVEVYKAHAYNTAARFKLELPSLSGLLHLPHPVQQQQQTTTRDWCALKCTGLTKSRRGLGVETCLS